MNETDSASLTLDDVIAMFTQDLPFRLKEMAVSVEQLIDSQGPVDERVTQSIDQLYRLTHTMIGTSGSLGFSDISMQSKHLQSALVRIRESAHIQEDDLVIIQSSFDSISSAAKNIESGKQ